MKSEKCISINFVKKQLIRFTFFIRDRFTHKLSFFYEIGLGIILSQNIEENKTFLVKRSPN